MSSGRFLFGDWGGVVLRCITGVYHLQALICVCFSIMQIKPHRCAASNKKMCEAKSLTLSRSIYLNKVAVRNTGDYDNTVTHFMNGILLQGLHRSRTNFSLLFPNN